MVSSEKAMAFRVFIASTMPNVLLINRFADRSRSCVNLSRPAWNAGLRRALSQGSPHRRPAACATSSLPSSTTLAGSRFVES